MGAMKKNMGAMKINRKKYGAMKINRKKYEQ